MKSALLPWLFFISFSQALLGSDQVTVITQHVSAFEFSEQLLGRQLHGSNATTEFSDSVKRKSGYGGHDEYPIRRLIQGGGRGAHGGTADVLQRPKSSQYSSAYSTLALPSSSISNILLQVSIGLLLVLSFYF